MDDGGAADGGVVAEVMAKHGRSAQPESLQVVAVLQALKEVVAGEGLSVTPTSLFAAAMSALEKPETQVSAQVCQAMCTLLAMVLPRVPNSVLRSKFVGCSAVLCRVLEAHRQQAAVAKCALQCLCQLLSALDPTNWPAAMAPFSVALSFVTDNRPKVRKRADMGMVEVLAALQGTPALVPASEAITKVCQVVLPSPEAAARAAAAASNKNRAAAEAAISKAVADTLHVLGMLKGCIALMAPQPIKSIVDLLFKLYPLKQQLLSRHATEVLTQLCGSGTAVPAAGTAASPHLSPSTLAEILTVVLDAGDQLWDRKDADTVLHLTRLVEAGFIRLAQADPALCAQRLPRAFHALVPQLCAEQDGVRFGTSQALRNLIVDCIDERMMNPLTTAGGKGGAGAAPLASIVAAVQSSLSPRYQEAWPLALPVVGTMLTRLGELPEGHRFSEGLLTTLGSILSGQQDAAEEQEQADDSSPLTSAVSSAADAALGAALRALGPDVVLQVLPLNLESAGLATIPPGSEPRTWMLPMLRRHVCGTKLGFWASVLLPLARTMAARSESAAAAGKNNLAQACHVLELQLWHCLPAFCSWATDLPEAYSLVVKDMAAAFQNREDLRPSVGQALERMCTQVRRALKASDKGSLVSAAEPLGALPHEQEEEDDEEGGGLWGQRTRGAEEEERLHELPPAHYQPETAEGALGALRAWCKNWLVLLFKVFLEQPPHVRGPTASAISAVCSLAEPAVLAPLFKTVITRLIKIQKDAAAEVPPPDMITDGGLDPTQRACSFLGLALCTSSGLDDTGLNTLVKAALPGATSAEPALQKKAYKVLAYVCQHRTAYLRSHLDQVLPAVLGGTAAALSASRRYRLRCLQPLVQLLANPAHGEEEEEGVLAGLRAVAAAAAGDDSDEEVQDANVNLDAKRDEVVVALVSEIVLSVKEANTKTRAIAYSLLIQLAHAMDEADPSPHGASDDEGDMATDDQQRSGDESGGLHKLFSIVMAGLVGSTPHMISATVMALARLLYEFASRLEGTVPRLLPAVLMLLRTKSREVVKSVLGFVKVCAMRMPVELMLPHLKNILEGLLIWAEDSKNKFKLKVRVVVERLARRCGFDEIAKAMPPSDSKLLTHIRKQHNRKLRRKGGSEAGSEEDFEGEEGEETRSRSGGKSLKGSERSSMARTARTSEWAHSRVFSDEEGEEGQGGRSVHGGKAGARSAPGSTRGRPSGIRLSEGAGDDPMDLLDASASRRLVRTSAGANRRQAGAGGDAAAGFRRDAATGKLVFEEEEEGGKGGRGAKRRRGRDDDNDYDSQDSDFDDLRGVADLGAAMKSAAKSVHFAKSFAGSQGAKSQGAKSLGGKSAGGKSSASRGSRGSAAATKKGPAKHSGERYKPKKGGAGGDATGKAKVEPYAYWQLDRKMLNRRRAKQAGASKSLAGVVGAAGAARGAKAKRQRTQE